MGAFAQPYMAEDEWGSIVSSVLLCDNLFLEPEMKKWHLGLDPETEPSIFTQLHYCFNIETSKYVEIKRDSKSDKNLESELMGITSLLCPFASIFPALPLITKEEYNEHSVQNEILGYIFSDNGKIINRMKLLNIPVEESSSSRSTIFTSSLNYIRELKRQGNEKKLREIADNIHNRMLQLTTFMKLMQRYEKDKNFDWAIGYIASSVAMMNYLTFGNNEGEPLFYNCFFSERYGYKTDRKGRKIASDPKAIMFDLGGISRYIYNMRKISPIMVELICHKDAKDVELTNKLCDKYAEAFVSGTTFSSLGIDVDYFKKHSNENEDDMDFNR